MSQLMKPFKVTIHFVFSWRIEMIGVIHSTFWTSWKYLTKRLFLFFILMSRINVCLFWWEDLENNNLIVSKYGILYKVWSERINCRIKDIDALFKLVNVCFQREAVIWLARGEFNKSRQVWTVLFRLDIINGTL